MYMHFNEDGIFQGLYASYEEAVSPNVKPIIDGNGKICLPSVVVSTEKYSTPSGDGTLYEVKLVDEQYHV